MPEMDGLEATRRIRSRESELGQHTPIIALAADGRPEDREACLAAGMDGQVARPPTIEALELASPRWLPDEGRAESAAAEPGIETLGEQIGEEETVRLFTTWKTETPRRREAMRIGLERKDPGAVAYVAHVLRSTCGLFGAREAARTGAAAEDTARDGNPSELPALCQRLEDEISRAIVDLELELAACLRQQAPCTRPPGAGA